MLAIHRIMCMFFFTISELDVFFVNNTPCVTGGENGVIYAQVAASRPSVRLFCRLKRFETADVDCTYKGSVMSQNLSSSNIVYMLSLLFMQVQTEPTVSLVSLRVNITCE